MDRRAPLGASLADRPPSGALSAPSSLSSGRSPPARGWLPRCRCCCRRLPGLKYSLLPGERHGRRRAYSERATRTDSHTAAPARPRSRPRGLLGSVVRSREVGLGGWKRVAAPERNGSSLEREIEISVPLLSGRIHPKRPEETSIVTSETTEEAFIHAPVESSCQAETWGV